jgi:hypothetical protein
MDVVSTLTLYLEDDDTISAVTSGAFDVCITLASTSGRVITQTKSASFTVRRFGSLDPLIKKLTNTQMNAGNGGAVAGAVIGILIGVCCLCTVCTLVIIVLVIVSRVLKKRTPVKQEAVQEVPLQEIVSGGYSQLSPSPDTLSPATYDPTLLPVIYDIPANAAQPEELSVPADIGPEQIDIDTQVVSETAVTEQNAISQEQVTTDEKQEDQPT